MQRIISILLITCLVLQLGSKLTIIARYQLNKVFIASVLCLNKEKPQAGCEGKCYLTKQLAQAEEHEHLPAGNLKLKIELLFVEQLRIFHFAFPSVNAEATAWYVQPIYISPSFPVFTPPKV